jgi:hypothetical protein
MSSVSSCRSNLGAARAGAAGLETTFPASGAAQTPEILIKTGPDNEMHPAR